MRTRSNRVCLTSGTNVRSTSISLCGPKSSRSAEPNSDISLTPQSRQNPAIFSSGTSTRTPCSVRDYPLDTGSGPVWCGRMAGMDSLRRKRHAAWKSGRRVAALFWVLVAAVIFLVVSLAQDRWETWANSRIDEEAPKIMRELGDFIGTPFLFPLVAVVPLYLIGLVVLWVGSRREPIMVSPPTTVTQSKEPLAANRLVVVQVADDGIGGRLGFWERRGSGMRIVDDEPTARNSKAEGRLLYQVPLGLTVIPSGTVEDIELHIQGTRIPALDWESERIVHTERRGVNFRIDQSVRAGAHRVRVVAVIDGESEPSEEDWEITVP